MKIAVLISIATHPQSQRAIPSPLDLKACALVLSLKAQNSDDVEVNFIYFGKQNDALKDYFGYGLDVITCYPAPDYFSAKSASAYLTDFDLIITGRRALSGFASGLFSYALAQALKSDCHSHIIDGVKKDDGWFFEQYLPNGFRRQISVELPAVINVHEAAEMTLNYSYETLNQGQFIQHDKSMLDKLSSRQVWQFRDKKQLRKRFKVKDELSRLSGDERMKKAVGMGGTVSAGNIKQLTAEAAAAEIWQLLADKKIQP